MNTNYLMMFAFGISTKPLYFDMPLGTTLDFKGNRDVVVSSIRELMGGLLFGSRC